MRETNNHTDVGAARPDTPFSAATLRSVNTLTWRFSLRGQAEVWRDDDLQKSGLSLIHLTAQRSQVLDFAGFCDSILETLEVMEQDADRLFLVKDLDDFQQFGTDGRIGVILGIQNAGTIATEAPRAELLWRLGIPVKQLTYSDANVLGDGCLEARGGGHAVT